MAKSFFTQSHCLLTDGSVTIASLREAIESAGFTVLAQKASSGTWEFSGESLVVAFRPEVNGTILIDIVDRPWPDHMGELKNELTLFAAWSMGHFGPLAYPRGLKRAALHAWMCPDAAKHAASHRGFVRLRLTYAVGAAPDGLVRPCDCDPSAELDFLTRLTLVAGVCPGVLCYFNSNGEILLGIDDLARLVSGARAERKLPLLVWCNVRLSTLSGGLLLMDTVGNGQLDVMDIEAIFREGRCEARDVGWYLRNVTHYLIDLGRELKSGERIDGPGETDLSWVIHVPENPTVAPPRPVLRLFAKADTESVEQALFATGRG